MYIGPVYTFAVEKQVYASCRYTVTRSRNVRMYVCVYVYKGPMREVEKVYTTLRLIAYLPLRLMASLRVLPL